MEPPHPGLASGLVIGLLSLWIGCAAPPQGPLPAPSPVHATAAPTTGPPTEPAATPAIIEVGALSPSLQVSLRWSRSAFASRFWLVDNLSGWDPRQTSPSYREAFERRFGWSAADERVAAGYRQIRRAQSRPVEEQHVLSIELLPPATSPADRFCMAFLEASSVEQAAQSLGLEPADRTELARVFRHFGPRGDELVAASDHRAAAESALRALAEQSRLHQYLAAIAEFYGLTQLPDEQHTVHVLWGADGHARATQLGPHLVIPISRAIALTPGELGTWLGVVAHEFAHYAAARLPLRARVTVRRRLLAELGVLNTQHVNVVDEATATALGNIVFVKTRLPELYDDRTFYAYEPETDVPHAIDSLARAIAPAAARWLAHRGSFSAGFLDAVVERHQVLFPPKVIHHTRVLTLFSETGHLERTFTGLFPAISRFRYRDAVSLKAFVDESEHPIPAARWVVATAAFAEQHRPELAPFAAPLATAGDGLHQGKHGACLAAARRSGDRGLDFVALGNTHDDLRRLLIAAHRSMPVPLEQPACVPVRP